MMFSIPTDMISSTAYCIPGLSMIGMSSFGTTLVAGRNLVPIPAAGIIAVLIFNLPLVYSYILGHDCRIGPENAIYRYCSVHYSLELALLGIYDFLDKDNTLC